MEPGLLKGIPKQDSDSDQDTASSKRDDGSDSEAESDDGGESPLVTLNQGTFTPPQLDATPISPTAEGFSVVQRAETTTEEGNHNVDGELDEQDQAVALVFSMAQAREKQADLEVQPLAAAAIPMETPLSADASTTQRPLMEERVGRALKFPSETGSFPMEVSLVLTEDAALEGEPTNVASKVIQAIVPEMGAAGSGATAAATEICDAPSVALVAAMEVKLGASGAEGDGKNVGAAISEAIGDAKGVGAAASAPSGAATNMGEAASGAEELGTVDASPMSIDSGEEGAERTVDEEPRKSKKTRTRSTRSTPLDQQGVAEFDGPAHVKKPKMKNLDSVENVQSSKPVSKKKKKKR